MIEKLEDFEFWQSTGNYKNNDRKQRETEWNNI